MGAQPNILDPTFSVDDNDVEPSSLWKARLKARIEQNLDFMIQDAREALHDALSTVTSEVEQKRLRDEFRGHTAQLGMNADREYEVELRKERDERKILKLQVDEALVREQQEILDAIRRNKEGGHGQRYTSASASYSSSRVDVYTPVAGPSYTSGRYERQPPATPSIYVPVSSFPQPYAPSSSFTQVYPLTSSSSQSTVHAAPSSSSASPPSQTYVNASSASSFTQNYTSPSGASPPTQTYVDAPMASSPGQLYTSSSSSSSGSASSSSSARAKHLAQQEMFRQRAEAIQRRRAEEKLNDQLNWAESIASAFPLSPACPSPSPSPPPMAPTPPLDEDQTLSLLLSHEQLWSILSSPSSTGPLSWFSFPWPILSMSPPEPHKLTLPRITAYVKAPYTMGMAPPETERERIKELLRRWHPDRFEVKFLGRVREDERGLVRESAGVVVRLLNELLGRFQ